jgi:hypothetical protein
VQTRPAPPFKLHLASNAPSTRVTYKKAGLRAGHPTRLDPEPGRVFTAQPLPRRLPWLMPSPSVRSH